MGCSELNQVISDKANYLLRGKNNITVLEAGCGSASYFRFAGVSKIVGIDISEKQLERNTLIQEKILGDIQTYLLPREAFDIAVCWDVLEHLSRPHEALVNMFNSLKVGGLLILGFPNLLSFKGIVTKFTPDWFHTVFYRYMNYSGRGFPTYFRLSIIPSRVITLAMTHGFSVAFQQLLEGGVTKRFKERFKIISSIFLLLDNLLRLLSGGKAQSLFLDNCAMILLKKEVEARDGYL